jgi:mono/diheme cytochrome c family protein
MPMTTAGASTGGSGGSGAGGGAAGGATGGAMGVQLQSPQYFVKLMGADAAPGQPAPPAYSAKICSSCHGANAEGVSGLGPEIRFTPKAYAVGVVRNGRKTPKGDISGMAPFAATTLPDADLDAINTWQNSFTKPTTGPGLYLAMCGNCHGPVTPTGGSAPVSIQGKSKIDVATYVRTGNGTDVAIRTTYMPAFDTTLLTDQELELIQAYLGSQ